MCCQKEQCQGSIMQETGGPFGMEFMLDRVCYSSALTAFYFPEMGSALPGSQWKVTFLVGDPVLIGGAE